MKVSINLNTLKSVAYAVSKEETRYYLQGVHLEAGKDGFTMVATDGHKLLCAFQTYGEHMPQDHMASFIIPASLIAKLKVKRNADAWAELTVNGLDLSFEYRGETFGGKAIDATFPDWRRVVPKETSGELAQFNPDILATIQAAACVFFDAKDKLVNVQHNGGEPALVKFGYADDKRFFGVAMPFRAAKSLPDHSWCYDASPIVTQAAAE
jgi:DNA polymerase III sliding clamp (beta) subunit (PCNA family)